MALVDLTKFSVVACDTSPFIYFMEQHPDYHKKLRELFRASSQGTTTIVTSVVTLIEALIAPLRKRQSKLVAQYQNILEGSDGINLVFIDPEIGNEAARLRAKYNLRIPDAIQLAVAIILDAPCFLTNDKRLRKVAEVRVILLEDLI